MLFRSALVLVVVLVLVFVVALSFALKFRSYYLETSRPFVLL